MLDVRKTRMLIENLIHYQEQTLAKAENKFNKRKW